MIDAKPDFAMIYWIIQSKSEQISKDQSKGLE